MRRIDSEGNYLVSREGEVYSRKSKKFLKPTARVGYLAVLFDGKSKGIHRLVAQAFLPNPQNLRYVNHIDGNKHNNHVDNLEWISPSGNARHAEEKKLTRHHRVRIEQCDKNGKRIKVYNSIVDALKENDVNRSDVFRVLRGKRKSAGGFKWRYLDKPNQDPGDTSDWVELPQYRGYLISREGQVCTKKFNRLRKPHVHKSTGYTCLSIQNNGKTVSVRIHKFVALAYLPNPNNYTSINHKDRNKNNNHVDNLEWCSHSHNMYEVVRTGRKGVMKVIQQDLITGKVLNVFHSIKHACEVTGFSHKRIKKACEGTYNTTNFVWSYQSNKI